jgi:hypothetical protein
MTNDGAHAYVYNAENEICSVGGTSCSNGTAYTYNGDGKRVEKSSGTLYWYGLGSAALLETDSGGGTPTEYVFLGGKRIARRDSSGADCYCLSCRLGLSSG